MIYIAYWFTGFILTSLLARLIRLKVSGVFAWAFLTIIPYSVGYYLCKFIEKILSHGGCL